MVEPKLVKVEVLSEAIRQREPFRFVGEDEALMGASLGKYRIIDEEKMEKFETLEDGTVLVDMVEQSLIQSYGRVKSYDLKTALKGEQVGKWRIRRAGQQGQFYDTRVMMPETDTDCLTSYDMGLKDKPPTSKRVKKKKIAWVQDLSINGGAEISNKLVIGVGLDCGFSIDLVTPAIGDGAMRPILGESDLIVLNNLWAFSPKQMRVIEEVVYIARIPYIKYEHDHREFYRPEFSRRLFQNSVLNVFLSPVHLKNHRESLGADGICLPLAIDVDFFKPVEGIERKPNSALISNCRNFKTWVKLQSYIDSHPELSFTVMANDEMAVHGQNVTQHQMVTYEKMPELYSEFEYLVHLLDGWGAGERVIFEGALCGCRIVSDERSGHMTWEKDLSDVEGLRAWLKEAPFLFWKEVERVI